MGQTLVLTRVVKQVMTKALGHRPKIPLHHQERTKIGQVSKGYKRSDTKHANNTPRRYIHHLSKNDVYGPAALFDKSTPNCQAYWKNAPFS